jgi:hypothetical protein
MLAWLRATAWAWRGRVLGRAAQHAVHIESRASGDLRRILHSVPGAQAALLAVGDSTGGVHGPAWIYPELCARLQSGGIAGLRLDYHRPNHLEACTQDVLAGIRRRPCNDSLLFSWMPIRRRYTGYPGSERCGSS